LQSCALLRLHAIKHVASVFTKIRKEKNFPLPFSVELYFVHNNLSG